MEVFFKSYLLRIPVDYFYKLKLCALRKNVSLKDYILEVLIKEIDLDLLKYSSEHHTDHF